MHASIRTKTELNDACNDLHKIRPGSWLSCFAEIVCRNGRMIRQWQPVTLLKHMRAERCMRWLSIAELADDRTARVPEIRVTMCRLQMCVAQKHHMQMQNNSAEMCGNMCFTIWSCHAWRIDGVQCIHVTCRLSMCSRTQNDYSLRWSICLTTCSRSAEWREDYWGTLHAYDKRSRICEQQWLCDGL